MTCRNWPLWRPRATGEAGSDPGPRRASWIASEPPLAFAATSNRLTPDASLSTLTPLLARSSRCWVVGPLTASFVPHWPDECYHNRARYRQICFSGPWPRRARKNCVSKAPQALAGRGLLRQTAASTHRDRSLWLGASLGPDVASVGS